MTVTTMEYKFSAKTLCIKGDKKRKKYYHTI